MKVLISASVIRDAHTAGRAEIQATPATAIITPEARTVAAQLGVKFVDGAVADIKSHQGNKLYETVRAQVMARLPAGSVSEAVVEQLIDKVLNESKTVGGREQGQSGHSSSPTTRRPDTPPLDKTRLYSSQKMPRGIKRVDGATVNFGALQGVIGAESVGVADVITAADKSPMSVGYMEWKDSFFPWKTASDEIEVVLDGVLHIRCDGQEIVCNAGDVIFIPRGSHVELGTTSHIRFLYVTCADPKRAA